MLEFLVALATVMYANVSVPVVPDPNYLQQLYPQQFPPNTINNPNSPLQAPVTQPELQGATQPTDIMTIINIAITSGLAYLFQRQKTTTDRRTYMAADTTLKLAQNNQSSDSKIVKLTYAVSCLADIVGKYHPNDMETYQTIEGVSLWTYIESLNLENNEDFKAKYVNKIPITTTGTQSKDKVVSTFNQVQQLVTPTPTIEVPKTLTKTTGRPDINKGSQKPSSTQSTS